MQKKAEEPEMLAIIFGMLVMIPESIAMIPRPIAEESGSTMMI